MLAKKYRLPVQSLGSTQGAAVRSRYFLLKAFPAAESYSRFGVTVSKRVYAHATGRNRLRRQIFSFVAATPPSRLHDYLVVASSEAAKLEQKDDIIKELTHVFKTYL